jgi:hypothetical protein
MELGSGYVDAPRERMQTTKASASLTCADGVERIVEELVWVVVEPSCDTPLPGGPPQAANMSESAAVAMKAAPHRVPRGHLRRSRLLARTLSFMMTSSTLADTKSSTFQ